jgi:hypothetical protein
MNSEFRLLTSPFDNYDQPLPLVTAQCRRSSEITAFPSRDQRERSMRMVFTRPYRAATVREPVQEFLK